MIKGVLLDLSGTVYEGDELIPGALETFQRLPVSHIPDRYLANPSRMPRNKILSRLQGMVFNVFAVEVFTAPDAIQDYLRKHRLSPWLLIHSALEEEFTEFQRHSPATVVICNAAHVFTCENLNCAFGKLRDDARLLAVGDNVYIDINSALKSGLKAALMRTSKYRPGNEVRAVAPGTCIVMVRLWNSNPIAELFRKGH